MEMLMLNTSLIPIMNGTSTNTSSKDDFCIGSFNPIIDVLMLLINLPIALFLIVDLIQRITVAASHPGNASTSSQVEYLYLHLTLAHLIFYIRVLLNVVKMFGGVGAIGQEYMTALHISSLSGASLFSMGMSLDLCMAVAFPVVYVNKKASTKQKNVNVFCTLVWLYTITVGILIVAYNIPMYHPLTMAAFCGIIVITLIVCGIILLNLNPNRSGKGSKATGNDKVIQSAVRFVVGNLIVQMFYFLPHVCVLVYLSAAKMNWLHLPCCILPLLMIVQMFEFVTPLIFFFSSGKLQAFVKRCSNICFSTER